MCFVIYKWLVHLYNIQTHVCAYICIWSQLYLTGNTCSLIHVSQESLHYETQDPADRWCWCIKFKTPTESFFRDVIFVKWTCISHTGVTVYLHAQTTHITVIQRDAIQINVFPIESLIPCLYATRELASYNVTSSESNLPLSQGCSRKDIKSDERLFL